MLNMKNIFLIIIIVSATLYGCFIDEPEDLLAENVVVVDPNAPIADFYASSTSIKPGQTVYFYNTSEKGSYYYWEFGDGNYSYEENTSNRYYSNGNYTVKLTAYNEYGEDVEEKINYITVSSTTSQYCQSGGSSTSYEYFESFTIGDFYKYTGNDYGYRDYTGNTVTLTSGGSVYVEFSPSSSDRELYWSVWIDLNKDGDFYDTDEYWVSGSGFGYVYGTVEVPYSSGTTRMRIAMKQGSYAEPCEQFSYGEVEDYTVSFVSKAVTQGSIIGTQKIYSKVK